MPVSAEAMTSLLNMIKQISSDETSRRYEERLQQKIATTTQTFLAKNGFLENPNRTINKINNQDKVRRSTKSKMLGNARLMSFEDLEKVCAERIVKETVKEAKNYATAVRGKRG